MWGEDFEDLLVLISNQFLRSEGTVGLKVNRVVYPATTCNGWSASFLLYDSIPANSSYQIASTYACESPKCPLPVRSKILAR